MHPNRKFHIADREEMAALVRAEGFGTVTVATETGLRAVHVPLLLDGERLLFHVAKGNAVHAALLARAEVLAVINGPHAYISPDWYGLDGRVPTWNYVAVELNGRAARLDDAALLRLLDALSAEHESRLVPKRPWTRVAMAPGLFEGLLKRITGFALEIREWRGTAKIDQDKPPEVRTRLAAALRERGDEVMAELTAPGSSPAFAGEGDHPKGGGGAPSPQEAAPPCFSRSLSPGNPREDK
jgi:transcriptional regulator